MYGNKIKYLQFKEKKNQITYTKQEYAKQNPLALVKLQIH